MAKPPPKTNVNVPVKIWIGPDVDGARLTDTVAGTTGNQLGRALNILDERGEWQGNLAQLDVQFKGDAANLPDERKREIYAYVGDGLAKGTQVAQAHRGKKSQRKRDRQKLLKGKKGAKAAKGAARSVKTWHQFALPPNQAFNDALAVALWMRFDEFVPPIYGVLFRIQNNPRIQLWVLEDRNWVSWRGLANVDWSGDKPGSEPADFDPGSGEFELKEVPNGLDEWRDNEYKKAESDRGKIKSGAPKDPRGEGTVTVQQDIEEPARALSLDARQAVDEYTKDWPTRIKVYYRLTGGGLSRLIPYRHGTPSVPIRPVIPVVALVDEVEAELADEAADGLTDGTVSGRDVLPKEGAGQGGGQGGGGGDGGGGQGGGQGQGEGQGAGADKELGLGSDVTAPPGQDVGKGGRGIAIYERYDPKGSIFPNVGDPNAESSELACEPYKDEPAYWDLPSGGPQIYALIRRIAARLDMSTCPYAANFCIQAARMIRIRTSQVQLRFTLDVSGDFSAELAVGALDEHGRFYFRGIDSLAVQYLQHLGGTVPLIRELMELVDRYVYPVSTFGPHHWFQDVMDEATQACGFIWLSANQIMMQQLLNSSRYGVNQRRNNPEYASVFAAMCKTRLADQAEMVILRTSLEKFLDIVGDRKGDDARVHLVEHLALQTAMETWNTKRVDVRKVELLQAYGLDDDLVTRLSDETNFVFRRGKSGEKNVSDAGSIVETTAGWKIRASDGELYDKDELSAIVELGQKVVTSIDPLMNQLLNKLVSQIPPLVDHPERVPEFLEELFTKMLTKNDEVSAKNKSDFEYAFEHAQIHKADPNSPATVDISKHWVGGWPLEGIHALAHSHVGVRFERDAFYTAAVARLISQEYHWRSFVEDMVFIFGTALTIICPPLGMALSFAANLALGLEKHAKASEQEAIYGALLKPEEVLNYAEIQIDLFLAKLQIALSFLELLPGVGKGVKGLAGLGKAAAKAGAKRSLGKIAKEAVMEELERIAKMSAENFVKALAIEMAEEAIEDRIVDAVVTPIIEAHIKEILAELREEGR